MTSYDESPEGRDRVRPGQYGSAGSGLNSESARREFGSYARVGADGERHFQRAMERAGIPRKYDVWYSVSIPRDPHNSRATRYRGDVDIAVASGNRLILIDVKRWSADGVYWSLLGIPTLSFNKLEPLTKNGRMGLSANMNLAVDRYSANLPGVSVSAVVVFVPTGKRGRYPTLLGLRWPGGIKSYQSNDGIRRIQRSLKGSEETVPEIRGLLGRMLR